MNSVWRLPLKYSDKENKGYCDALIPSQCRIGCDDKGVFECIGGERVRVEWLGVFRNEKGESQPQLEWIAQNLYGWTFERIEAQWYARLHKLDGWWEKIRLRKI